MKYFGFFTLLIIIFFISVVNASYVDEYSSAYTWAYNNGITTMTTIDKANMYGRITRIELSKMISNYAINVLKKNPDTSKKCKFDDISDNLDKQYDNGVTNACQLGLMGQGITKFRPNDYVTRAEFGTILSRLLYGDKYNGGSPYYKKHINQLNVRGIMTNINNLEKGMELRGNVMVMLKRSETLGDINIPSFEELDDVVYDKCPSDFDGSYDVISKKSFIIPYKDGYIGYEFGGQEGRLLYLTYRKLEKPCELVSRSDEIFWWNGHGFDESLNKVYKAIGHNDSGHTEEVVKNLNCNNLEEKCIEELNNYIYNLIIGVEQQDYFSEVMDNFKKSL